MNVYFFLSIFEITLKSFIFILWCLNPLHFIFLLPFLITLYFNIFLWVFKVLLDARIIDICEMLALGSEILLYILCLVIFIRLSVNPSSWSKSDRIYGSLFAFLIKLGFRRIGWSNFYQLYLLLVLVSLTLTIHVKCRNGTKTNVYPI